MADGVQTYHVYGHDLEPYSAGEFAAWAEGRTWTFAKTMPKIPHFYTKRREEPGEVEYYRALATIRADGEYPPVYWGRKPWVYFNAGGYRYWCGPDDAAPTKDYNHLNRTYADPRVVDLVRADVALHRLPLGDLLALLGGTE